jgi:hypothetical protein
MHLYKARADYDRRWAVAAVAVDVADVVVDVEDVV